MDTEAFLATHRALVDEQAIFVPQDYKPGRPDLVEHQRSPEQTIIDFLKRHPGQKRAIVFIGHGSLNGHMCFPGHDISLARLQNVILDNVPHNAGDVAVITGQQCYGGQVVEALEETCAFAFSASHPDECTSATFFSFFFSDANAFPTLRSRVKYGGQALTQRSPDSELPARGEPKGANVVDPPPYRRGM